MPLKVKQAAPIDSVVLLVAFPDVQKMHVSEAETSQAEVTLLLCLAMKRMELAIIRCLIRNVTVWS